MPKKEKLDSYHYHELLDRLHLVLCNIDDFLLDHPVATKEKDIRKKIKKASEKLSDAYQAVGTLEYKKFNDESDRN